MVKTGIPSWPASLPGSMEFSKYKKISSRENCDLGSPPKRVLFIEPNAKGSGKIHSGRVTTACKRIWIHGGIRAAGSTEASDHRRRAFFNSKPHASDRSNLGSTQVLWSDWSFYPGLYSVFKNRPGLLGLYKSNSWMIYEGKSQINPVISLNIKK